MSFNLPDNVTDADIDEHMQIPDECPLCDGELDCTGEGVWFCPDPQCEWCPDEPDFESMMEQEIVDYE